MTRKLCILTGVSSKLALTIRTDQTCTLFVLYLSRKTYCDTEGGEGGQYQGQRPAGEPDSYMPFDGPLKQVYPSLLKFSNYIRVSKIAPKFKIYFLIRKFLVQNFPF